jgi:hypothetical protein
LSTIEKRTIAGGKNKFPQGDWDNTRREKRFSRREVDHLSAGKKIFSARKINFPARNGPMNEWNGLLLKPDEIVRKSSGHSGWACGKIGIFGWGNLCNI